jgi:hypothetical protein
MDFLEEARAEKFGQRTEKGVSSKTESETGSDLDTFSSKSWPPASLIVPPVFSLILRATLEGAKRIEFSVFSTPGGGDSEVLRSFKPAG